jgi:hypothetical protein
LLNTVEVDEVPSGGKSRPKSRKRGDKKMKGASFEGKKKTKGKKKTTGKERRSE